MNLNIVFLFTVLRVHHTMACAFKAAKPEPGRGKFKPYNHETFDRQLAGQTCCYYLALSISYMICGMDFSGTYESNASLLDHDPLDLPWTVYIHLKLNASNKILCVGTVVNSNLVITSHKCLQKKDRFSVHDVLLTKGTAPNSDESPLASVRDITLSTQSDLASSSNLIFKVKKIIYSERFAYDSVYVLAPETDIAILVVDYDFTNQTGNSTKAPICLPYDDKLNTQELLNRKGYYQGIRHDDGKDLVVGIYNSSSIRMAEECNNDGDLGLKPATKDTLCLKFTEPGPTREGGSISITVNATEEYIPTSFLIGIATWVEKTILKGEHRYAYFTNMNTIVKYIEHKAYLLGSRWCPTQSPEEGINSNLDCECGLQKEEDKLRIQGGEFSDVHEFTWMAKFKLFVGTFKDEDGKTKDKYKLCGGSVINDRMLLTSASCFVRRIAENASKENLDKHVIHLRAVYADEAFDNSMNLRYHTVHAKEVIFHRAFPEQNPDRGVNYDIALVVLQEPLVLGKDTAKHKRIVPICLPTPGYLKGVIGQSATVVGWGAVNLSVYDSTYTGKLKKLEVPIRPLVECEGVDPQVKGNFRGYHPTDTKICATWMNPQKSVEEGDTGGPLMHLKGKKFTQVGIVSYPNNSAEDTKNIYYANVEALLPYIYYHSNKNGAQYCKN